MSGAHTLNPDDRQQLLDPAGVVGRTFARRYEVRRFIGEGGFSWVYEVHDARFQEFGTKAIKIMRKDKGLSPKQFLAEARVAQGFNHPHSVVVSDYGTDDDLPWMVMEYLEGRSLDAVLEEYAGQDGRSTRRSLNEKTMCLLVEQISEALEAAHEKNLVHRDLKPHNIMHVHEGQPGEHFKLMDFGIASKIDADTSKTIRRVELDGAGTPEYIAPEQLDAQLQVTKDGVPDTRLAYRADIYSFGVIIYQLLTGRVPFPLTDGSMHAYMSVCNDIRQTPAPPPSFFTQTPVLPAVEKLVLECLEKDPQKRPSSMREVRERFLEAYQPAIPQPRRGLFLLAIMLTAVAAVLAAVFFIPGLFPSPSMQPRVGVIAVPPNGPITAGSEVSLAVTINRTMYDGPVNVVVEPADKLPDGIELDPIGPVELPSEQNSHNMTVRTDLNADVPEDGEVAVPLVIRIQVPKTAKNVETKEEEVRIIVRAPTVWGIDRGFTRHEEPDGLKAKIVRIGSRYFYRKLEQQVGSESVVYVLIEEIPDADGDRTDFCYMMENKVWVSLFEQADFVKDIIDSGKPTPWREVPWYAPSESGHLPVTNVSFDEAHRFAQWMAEPNVPESDRKLGRLPNQRQWDAAAGYYRWKDGDLTDPGPYRGAAPYDGDGIAVDREGPAPVGSLDDYISVFEVRDMAGNGQELTRSGRQAGFDETHSFPLPTDKRNPNDWLYLRGWGWGKPEPLYFETLDAYYTGKSPSLGFDYYPEGNGTRELNREEDVGFRVVLEP